MSNNNDIEISLNDENIDIEVDAEQYVYVSSPNLQTKSLTITENGTTTVNPDTGYDGLSSVSITTEVSGGSAAEIPDGIRFSNSTFQQIDFLGDSDTSNLTTMRYMFQSCANLTSVPVFDTSNVTNMQGTFSSCSSLTSVPLFDTSNATTMQSMFSSCTNLTTVPALDTSKVTDMRSIFGSCTSLSNNSLNNILLMCINATRLSSSNKNLKYIGLSSAQADICQTLSNWETAASSGWTTGY